MAVARPDTRQIAVCVRVGLMLFKVNFMKILKIHQYFTLLFIIIFKPASFQ